MLQKHQSRPLWARELKLRKMNGLILSRLSRPLWARELKLNFLLFCLLFKQVAPPVGA